MLAYLCKNCDKFTIFGYINKYEERFCCVECYKKYCEKHNYKFDIKDIYEVEL